jgi:Na+/citrate or Na+/malate symporter
LPSKTAVYYPFNFISRHVTNDTSVNWGGWLWTAYGGALMALLMAAKQRFVWWPIHPMSLPVSSMWMTDTIVLSVFISWMIKGVILKFGGPALYRKGKPLFIGLVVGQFVAMGFWVVVDYLTGMTDNVVYSL